MPKRSLAARRIGAAVCLTATSVALAVVSAPAAHAAGPYSVATFAELASVLSGGWTDTSPVVVDITADLTATGADSAEYWGTQPLTINGNGHTITFSTDEELILVNNAATVVTINDLTLTGSVTAGHASAAVSVYGASIAISNVTVPSYTGMRAVLELMAPGGNITVDDSSFANAHATGPWAGAMLLHADTATITGSTFTNNSSEGPGAISGQTTDLTIVSSTFISNDARGWGGVVELFADLTLTDSTFTGNTSEVAGGVAHSSGTMTVTGSTFVGNTAMQTGGALASDGPAVIADSYFSANEADYNGGAISAPGGLSLTGSTFVGNSAGADGGAIALPGTSASAIASSTFNANTAVGAGGAIVVADSPLDIQGSTFSGNTAATMAHVRHTNASVTVSTSVFTLAAPTNGCGGSGTMVSQGYTFDADGTCSDGWAGTGDLGSGLDPQLGALADNGGPTLTMLPASTSPLVNAVPSSYVSAPFNVDQRGASRGAVAAHTTDGRDIGAVELLGPVSLVIPTSAGNVTVSASAAIAISSDPSDIVAVSAAAVGGTPPAGVSFPCGVVGFTVFTVPGDDVTITIDLPRPVTSAWKTGAGAWTEIPGLQVLNGGTRLVYTATEGGALDEDAAMNGEFVDPVGPGVSAGFTG